MSVDKTNYLLRVIMVAALGAAAGAGHTFRPAQAADSLRTAIDAWVAMWNSYDLNEVGKLFLQDDRVSYFSSEREGLIRGIAAVREHHRGFGFLEGGRKQDNKLWMEDLIITPFGTASVVTGTWHFLRPTGRKQRGRVTFVYVQQGGEFRLAHMHFANYPDAAR